MLDAFYYDKQITITRKKKIMMMVLMMMTVKITFVCHIEQFCTRLVAGRGHQLLIIIDAGTDHPEQQGYIYIGGHWKIIVSFELKNPQKACYKLMI